MLHVHGSVAFVDMAGSWQPQAAVRTAVAAPPPENNTGRRRSPARSSRASRRCSQIPGRTRSGGTSSPRNWKGPTTACSCGLTGWGEPSSSPGAGGRRVPGSCPANRRSPRRHRRHDTRGRHGRQRRECRAPTRPTCRCRVGAERHRRARRAAQGPFASDPPLAELRALASLFPSPCTSSWPPTSPIASLADLRGKRVEIGLPDPGTRLDALAVLKAAGIGLDQLTATSEVGLVPGLRALADGAVDAVIATISARRAASRNSLRARASGSCR